MGRRNIEVAGEDNFCLLRHRKSEFRKHQQICDAEEGCSGNQVVAAEVELLVEERLAIVWC